MKVLILGGSQFVSQELAKYMINQGYQVTIMTRGIRPLSYRGYHEHLLGDRRDGAFLKRLENLPFDYIIDISAYTREDVSLICDHINKENLKRYVFCSTGGVYLPSHFKLGEDAAKGKNQLLGDYGLNKLEAENYLLNRQDIPVSIFRPTYIYGPHNNIYREGYFFDRLGQGPIPFPLSRVKIQFLHIYDLVRFVESLMISDLAINQAYNISHESTYTFMDIFKVFESVLGIQGDYVAIDSKVHRSVSYYPYYNMHYELSMKKLRDHGLYQPVYDLYEGLKVTYDWYQEAKPKDLLHRMNHIDQVLKEVLDDD